MTAVGANIGKLIVFHRLGGDVAVAIAAGFLTLDQGGQVLGIELHCAVTLDGRRWLARSQVDLEPQAGDRQLIVGQGPPPGGRRLTVDAGAIRAAQIA